MDIINIICLITLILPFLFGIYLFVSRLNLSCVNRNVLNYGNFAINSLLLIIYSIFSIFILKDNLNLEFNLTNLTFNGLDFNFGFLINSDNIILILIAMFCYSAISMYSAYFYFEKKKQFIFTKQRFYSFLSILAFNTYLFLMSSNMFQLLIFWILQGVIIFIFSYFDIFKNSVNFNTTRFNRINIIGDFALLTGILILFKYLIISNYDISGLNTVNLEEIFQQLHTNINAFELWLCVICFFTAISAKLAIFPFNCYFSFFANSSDIFYICVSSLANLIFGIYIFLLTVPLVELSEYKLYLIIFFGVSGLISLFLTIFEKNIKIIFGYLISAINSFFIAGYLFLHNDFILLLYVICNLIPAFKFMKSTYNNKFNIKPRFFTKKKSFIIERCHIFFFEKLPLILFKVLNIIDKFFVQNLILFFIDFINLFINIFVIKVKNKGKFSYIKAILLIFVSILMIAIFVALFGSGRYNSELIG